MRFLIDAQLPRRLAILLDSLGHDAIHTLDLPDGNRTSEREVLSAAEGDDRVVISKDRDFRDSHLLGGAPRRLLLVCTGNISNKELLALFTDHLHDIIDLFEQAEFLELEGDKLIGH